MGKPGRRGYGINPLAHLWLERKPLETSRAVWIARVELGVVITVSLIFWAMVVIYVWATIRPLTTTTIDPFPAAMRNDR
jgi:hypothetical protein